MISQEIVEIWNSILGSLEPQLWYIVEDTDDYLPSLRVAISLDERQYDTLLLRSGIRVKRGGLYGISTDQLAYLKTTVHRQHDLRFTRYQLKSGGKRSAFISIGEPTFRNPSLQAKRNPRVLQNCRGNGLNEAQLRLLERLCAERATGEEPELIVEGQLHPPPQIQEQYEQENEPPQAEEAQERRPARGRRVLQELQLQPVLERRARRRADETQQEEANQIRLHRRAVAQEEHQLHPPPERRIRPRRSDNVKHPRRGIKNSSIA